jgi:hypothetical protein
MPFDAPHTEPQTAYALEGHNGATGLYLDPQRRHFILVTPASLPEGAFVVDSWGRTYVLTWAIPDVLQPNYIGDAETQARYRARAGQQARAA